MKIRAILQLLRIHTASLTMPGVMLGAIIAGDTSPLNQFYFATWALLFHAAGFLDNNICDYPYDKDDPAKAHFPLVSGEVRLYAAEVLRLLLFLLTAAYGTILARGNPISFFFLFMAIFWGLAYNRRCKKDTQSPAYITASFVSLPLFSYFSTTSELNTLIILLSFYGVFLMMFQIAIEGYLKDLASDKRNLLRQFGSFTRDARIYISKRTRTFAWILRLPTFILAGAIIFHVSSDMLAAIFTGLLIGLTVKVVSSMLHTGDFDNKKVVKKCALTEILVYFTLIVALQGILGWSGVIFFVFFPLTWFMTLNRLSWGTWIRPAV